MRAERATAAANRVTAAEIDDARWIGAVLGGRYRVTRLMGSGGMGLVYEARHELIDRRFAVKLLHPALARRKNMTERFEREARACGALAHECIAAVVDFGAAEDGTPFLVMEYLEGCDLATLIAACGPLPVPRATDIVRQACFGLEVAHERGVIHRDLKPENLFVCRNDDGYDRVKILDFGIAKLLDGAGAARSRLTRTGTTLGTPYYMSPEQARGDKDVDHRSDIYALGVILYELLGGAVPHPGDSYNEVIYRILNKPAAPLDELRPGLPASLYQLVARAMARSRDDRVSSAAALAADLRPYAMVPFSGEVGTETPSCRASTQVDGMTSSTMRERASDPRADRESAPPGRAASSPRASAAARRAEQGDPETPPPARRLRGRTIWPWLTAPLLLAATLLAANVGDHDAPPLPELSPSAPGSEARPTSAGGSEASRSGSAAGSAALPAEPSAMATASVDPTAHSLAAQPRSAARSPSRGMKPEASALPSPSGSPPPSAPVPGGSESRAPKADEASAASGESPVTYDRDNPYGR